MSSRQLRTRILRLKDEPSGTPSEYFNRIRWRILEVASSFFAVDERHPARALRGLYTEKTSKAYC